MFMENFAADLDSSILYTTVEQVCFINNYQVCFLKRFHKTS